MAVNQEHRSKARDTLKHMLNLLGFDADVADEEQDDNVLLKVKSEDAGRIIGRKGRYLDSLELILNRMLKDPDSKTPRVVIDIDGYQRQQRGGGKAKADADVLEKMAVDTAKEVKRWGEPKTLGPLNAHERRIVHTALKDNPDVETESGDEESNGKKKIVVRLARPS